MGRNDYENKPKNKMVQAPRLNLSHLREDVAAGYPDMGRPDRGYYIATDQGIYSLRGFCSVMVASDSLLVTYTNRLREVQVIDGANYAMREFSTTNEYMSHLSNKMKQEKIDLVSDPTDTELSRAIIDYVYDGELDKNALLDPCGSQKVQDAMKKNIVDAMNGMKVAESRKPLRHAGVYAYENKLAPTSRNVYRMDELDKATRFDKFEGEWLKEGAKIFAEQALIESNVIDENGSIDFFESIYTFDNIISDAEEYNYEAHYENQWNGIRDHLIDKDVVLMLNDGSVPTGLNGMKKQAAVHQSVGVSEDQDKKNSQSRYIAKSETLDSGITINSHEKNEAYDDGLGY